MLAVFFQADYLESDSQRVVLPPKEFESRGGKPGGKPDTLLAAAHHGPVARRHVARIVCLPTRATGHAVRQGPPLPRLGMRTDPLQPHGRLGFPCCYYTQ